MKIIFEIDGDEPRELDEAKVLLNATNMRIALWDIDKLFRNALKYEGFAHEDYLTPAEEFVVEKLQTKFNEFLEEYDIEKLVKEMP